MRKMYLIFGILSLSLLALGGAAKGYLPGLQKLFGSSGVVLAESSGKVGKDGDLVVSSPGTIVNRYATLAVDALAGSAKILVTYPAGDNGLRADLLAAGDLIMIVQMAGATIDSSNTASYGQVTSLNNAGRYEYVTISKVEGGMLTLNPPCGGLLHSYTVNGKVQILRVPRYTSLRVNSGASLTAPAWNGSFGGIVAVQVDNNVVIDGEINVSGRGFRGGGTPPLGGATGRAEYVTAQQDFGAEKGEGIAGFQQGYDVFGGRYARGAAGNAGGGGTSHNTGGGGGANGNNGFTWTGQGVMDGTAVGAAAWQLDPGYIDNGNKLATSSGGGRGGYSYAANNQDALTVGPNNPLWGGDQHRSVGGLGGRPMPQDTAGRIFMGGGGGGGSQNDLSGGIGGNAGGMIYIIAKSVTGSGSLISNGDAGSDTKNQNRDGAGGGGAGGTIVVYADSVSGLKAEARGGRGGSQKSPIIPNETESQGPGGGGGGGFIAYKGGSLTADVSGGTNGVTSSVSLTEFPSNGATGGASGLAVSSIPGIPYCSAIADLAISNTNNQPYVVPGLTTTYTIVAQNNGPSAIYGAEVIDTLPAGFIQSTKAWTCTASPGSSCAAASGTGDLSTKVNLQSQGTATFTFTGLLDPAFTGVVNNAVQLNAPAGATETDSANNRAADSDVAIPQADLVVTMVGAEPKYIPGTNVTFQIDIRNLGPSFAVGFGISDQLPNYISLISVGCNATSGNCGNNVSTGNLVQQAAMTLGVASNNLIRLTVVGFINPSAVGVLSNTAALIIPPVTPPGAGGGSGTTIGGFFDPNTSSNSATVQGVLAPQANLVISKTNSQSTVIAGTNTTYQIEVINLGPSDAAGFSIVDDVPATLVLSSSGCTPTGGSCGTNASSGNSIRFDNASLPFGAARALRLTVAGKLGNASSGDISNTASILIPAGASFEDPEPGSNSSTDTDAFVVQSDLAASITGPTSKLLAGSRVTYNLEISNSGPSKALGATVVNTLPVGLESATWTCVATSGSSCAAATGVGGISTQLDLDVNGKATFVLNATISRSFGGTLINQVSVAPVAGADDPVIFNNVAQVQTQAIRSEGPTFIIGWGLSRLGISQPFRIALDVAGLSRQAVDGARFTNQTLSLPVWSGAIDLFSAAGEVNHSGGLALTAGNKRLQILSVTIDTIPTPAILSAVVAASTSWDQNNTGTVTGRIKLAELTLPASVELPMRPMAFSTLYIHQATLSMSSELANLLNSFFGVTGFTRGLDMGNISFQLNGTPERARP